MTKKISRRTVLQGGLAGAAGVALGCGGKPAASAPVAMPTQADKPAIKETIRFIHVTDTHLDLQNPQSVLMVERFAEKVATNYSDIDFVLFGGDNFNNNVETGKDANRLKEILKTIPAPTYSVRGNKESHHVGEASGYSLQMFQDDFGKGVTWSGRDWKLDAGPVTILGIDTTIDGQDNGLFAAESLSFVETELSANPNKRHVLLSHHPYNNFWGGTTEGDLHKYVLGNSEEVRNRLFHHNNLALTLTGHKHLDDISEAFGTKVIATVGFVMPQDPNNLEDRRFRVVEIGANVLEQQLVSIVG